MPSHQTRAELLRTVVQAITLVVQLVILVKVY